MKNVVILFGEMGCGKNYWGERLAKEKGYTFYDGDRAAPPKVIDKVSRFEMLDRELIREFVDRICILAEELVSDNEGVIIAQALYFNEDRIYIREVLRKKGYQVTFHWVRAPFWKNMKQIYSRPDGLKWVVYWLKNKRWFEVPTHEYMLINGKGFVSGPVSEQ